MLHPRNSSTGGGDHFTGDGEPLAVVTGMLLRLIPLCNWRSTGSGELRVAGGTAMLDPRNSSTGSGEPQITGGAAKLPSRIPPPASD